LTVKSLMNDNEPFRWLVNKLKGEDLKKVVGFIVNNKDLKHVSQIHDAINEMQVNSDT
jgi:hypothetical protein